LADVHGLHRTARTLPIDYVGLRKRLSPTCKPPKAVARPEFVELLPTPAQNSTCVEILRVQLSGTVDWSQLFRAWRQAER
jgi:hypothetical protein